jgi:hypothetical protein
MGRSHTAFGSLLLPCPSRALLLATSAPATIPHRKATLPEGMSKRWNDEHQYSDRSRLRCMTYDICQ